MDDDGEAKPVSGCVFCRVLAGDLPGEIVTETRHTVILVPLDPYCPGHVLVVPRVHVMSAATAPAIAGLCATVGGRWLSEHHRGVGNLLTSSGAEATQTVQHLHVHVLPRGPEDGLASDWPWMRPDH